MATRRRRHHELYDLCDNADSDDTESIDSLRQWLKDNKNDKMRFRAAAVYQDNDTRMTPLHRLILMKRPPQDVVETLIQNAPDSVKIQDKDGWLPLHFACACRGFPIFVFVTLVNAYPESLDVANERGWLPIHVAYYSNVNLEFLDVISKYSLPKQNNSGETPVDLLKASRYAEKKDRNGRIPLHHAGLKGVGPCVILALIFSYPDGLFLKDKIGKTPTEYFSAAQLNEHKDVIQMCEKSFKHRKL